MVTQQAAEYIQQEIEKSIKAYQEAEVAALFYPVMSPFDICGYYLDEPDAIFALVFQTERQEYLDVVAGRAAIHNAMSQYRLELLAHAAAAGCSSRVLWFNGGEAMVLRNDNIMTESTTATRALASLHRTQNLHPDALKMRSSIFKTVPHKEIAGEIVLDWLR